MHSLLIFVQNWNFVFPLLLWGARGAYVRLKTQRRRVRVWGIRRGSSVRILVDQQRTDGNYMTGDLGPLAEARAAQKLITHFRSLGLDTKIIDSRQFEQDRSGNIILAGVLSRGDCLMDAALACMDHSVSVSRDKFIIDGSELAIELELSGTRLGVSAEYAIFAHARNPDDRGHALAVVAALTSNGLEAAVDSLLQRVPDPVLTKNLGDGGFIIKISAKTRETDIKPIVVPLPAA